MSLSSMTDVPRAAPSNVAGYLLAGHDSGKIALLTPRQQYTYGELRAAVSAISAWLLEAGAGKGDCVLLVSENSFFWVAAYLGTLQAGLVSVPLPLTTPERDLSFVLESTGAKFALLQAGFSARLGHLFGGCRLLTDRTAPLQSAVVSQTNLASLPAAAGGEAFSELVGPGDLASLMFTSGSTGKPRGVMVSHGNIIANTQSIIEYLELTSRDRIMAVLPFHYCFGTSLLQTHLRAGGTLVLDSRFLYPEVILQRMLETECTGFAGVPSHYQILLRNSSLARKSFPRLRYVQQAGGSLAPHFIRELRQALPDARIFIMYGQTEATARLSYLPPELLDTKLGSVGKGIPGVRLEVLDSSGREVRPGEVGEIVAEGANVAQGYWNDPEETAAIFRDGKLHTGDLATVDEEGFIYIVDRAKDFLKCGGKRVSCKEIEKRLLEFPCLLEAAVVAAPDEVLGEAVNAFLVSRRPECTLFDDCFRAFCRQYLPQELHPKQAVVVAELPKNSSGKLVKRELKATPQGGKEPPR